MMVKFTRKARGHFVTVLDIKYGFLVSPLKKLSYCVGARVKQKFDFIKRVDKG